MIVSSKERVRTADGRTQEHVLGLEQVSRRVCVCDVGERKQTACLV